MDNETRQMFELIINKLDGLGAGQKSLEARMNRLEEDVKILKEDVKILKEDVKVLKEDVKILKEDVKVLKEDVKVLKEDIKVLKEDVEVLKEDAKNLEAGQNILKIRLDETYQVATSVKHSNEVRNAQIDNLQNKVAKVQGTINGVGEFIIERKAL